MLISLVYTLVKNLYKWYNRETVSKSAVFDGFVVNFVREPLLFSFVLDEPHGYIVFCERGTLQYTRETNLFGTLYPFK